MVQKRVIKILDPINNKKVFLLRFKKLVGDFWEVSVFLKSEK